MHACEVMKKYIIANIFSHASFQTAAYGRCLSVLANVSYLMLILMSVSDSTKGSRSFHILSVSVSFCCSDKQPWNLSGFLLPRVCFLFTGLLWVCVCVALGLPDPRALLGWVPGHGSDEFQVSSHQTSLILGLGLKEQHIWGLFFSQWTLGICEGWRAPMPCFHCQSRMVGPIHPLNKASQINGVGKCAPPTEGG